MILLVDNYDSFTFNVYQNLAKFKKTIVYRNDKLTLDEAILLNPSHLVVSPGPGYPASAGISNKLIAHFAGRIPILGVCLGHQCIYEIYGGTVTKCGDIHHGKTSFIQHDGIGLFEGLPPINVTRYHSLAGSRASLPDCLEVTCATESGIIMGVRHKTFTVQGVQFHPESIASEHGDKIFENFVNLQSGTWDNEKTKLSILAQIKEQRLRDVNEQSSQHGRTMTHLETSLSLGLAPDVIDFHQRISSAINNNDIAILAEIKRASPSKGNINLEVHAALQALQYRGAAAISVLTEPKWFKGSMQDLSDVRQVIKDQSNRPAILCKDFILTKYQIIQARLAGADTILLIVSILDNLVELLHYSRSLGMEPLVEVATEAEMTCALESGAKIIGINNRNLNTFIVDMTTTTRLAKLARSENVILLALSGIKRREDIYPFLKSNIRGFLIGQGLMESPQPSGFIQTLKPIIKICGITSPEDASLCSKATHLGLIFAESPRQITKLQAKRIINTDQKFVGVFANQSVETINDYCSELNLDIAQIHSQMTANELALIKKPKWYVITVVEQSVDEIEAEMNEKKNYCDIFLLDSAKGSKKKIPKHVLDELHQRGWTFIVAGGLTGKDAHEMVLFGGIDVCSGLETSNRIKSAEKVKELFANLETLNL
jgi:anthranilate synthase/indole-3-glycerol phosphate synthase/phosphoribosylanthranilate isomerase